MSNQNQNNNKTFSLPTSIKIVVSESRLENTDIDVPQSGNLGNRSLPDKDESNNFRNLPFVTQRK